MRNREIQYRRKLDVIVSKKSGDGINLSNLRCVFKVKKADSQTPNAAEIKIYNLENETVNQIRKEFTGVILQGGYESNFGVFFRGNIKQTKIGKENGTDTYLIIYAGDGDEAYNFAVVNKTLAPGATYQDQVQAAMAPMESKGVSSGYMAPLGSTGLPRGKVMFGQSKKYLQQAAKSSNTTWSIQDQKLQFVPMTSYLPNEVVVLNSATGLIGAPQETNEGLSVRCLLNPLIKVGGRIKLDQDDINAGKLGSSIKKPSKKGQKNKISTDGDGVYRVLVVEYDGDTRDTAWYADLVCLNVNQSAPIGEQVQDL